MSAIEAMHLEKLYDIARAVKTGEPCSYYREDLAFKMKWRGYVQPKQRARDGTFHTPPETRRFEKDVREQSLKVRDVTNNWIFDQPVHMNLVIFDAAKIGASQLERYLMNNKLVYQTNHGDTENKQKAIQDAMNGIVYTDDRFIVSYKVERQWRTEPGFIIEVYPVGLNKTDVENVKKILRSL